jgi:hypothetical protein
MTEHIEKRTHRLAHVETYEVTDDELDRMERGYSSRQNDVAFLSIAASIFVAFVVVWLTIQHPATPTWREQFYIAVLVMSGGGGLYLFFRWRRSVKLEKPLFEKIRARAVGPLGEEGKELKPSELDQLTPREPDQKRD